VRLPEKGHFLDRLIGQSRMPYGYKLQKQRTRRQLTESLALLQEACLQRLGSLSQASWLFQEMGMPSFNYNC